MTFTIDLTAEYETHGALERVIEAAVDAATSGANVWAYLVEVGEETAAVYTFGDSVVTFSAPSMGRMYIVRTLEDLVTEIAKLVFA